MKEGIASETFMFGHGALSALSSVQKTIKNNLLSFTNPRQYLNPPLQLHCFALLRNFFKNPGWGAKGKIWFWIKSPFELKYSKLSKNSLAKSCSYLSSS